jgi:hypothetical protein
MTTWLDYDISHKCQSYERHVWHCVDNFKCRCPIIPHALVECLSEIKNHILDVGWRINPPIIQ